MRKIVKLEQTCSAAPEQYEGFFDDGQRVYMRCRFGVCEIRIGTQEEWDKWELRSLALIKDPGEPYKGNFGPGDMAELFREARVECEVDVDKIPEHVPPFTSFDQMVEWCKAQPVNLGKDEDDDPIVVSSDKDVLNGKLGHLFKKEDLIPLDKELLETLRKLVKNTDD